MNIIKRNGSEQEFNTNKIEKAITKAIIEVGERLVLRDVSKIANDVKEICKKFDVSPTVEEVQDLVELKLTEYCPKAGIAYVRFRDRQTEKREVGWNLSEMGQKIFERKYRHNQESFEQFLDRVSAGNEAVRKRIANKQFLFGGRILAGRGLDTKGITYSNCYVLPSPEDNIESIYQRAGQSARTFSYGGGVGIDLSTLRPNGMKVNNSAKTTTGAVSFMDTFNSTASVIGQNNRRGALMLSMDVDHPDVIEFIKSKTDLKAITSANISVKISDAFFDAVIQDDMWELSFTCENGDTLTRTVHAKNLYRLICKVAWDYADPGILFWDTVNDYHIMSEYEDYKFTTTNPCGELPLMDYGACLLGSLNLSEFVINPFTSEAEIDVDELKECVKDAIIALNEVLDENIPLHPLPEQREYAENYRAIGLGIMGLSDMFLKTNCQYGDRDSLMQSRFLANIIADTALEQSALLAREYGSFPKCDNEKIANSLYVRSVANERTIALIKDYGLRNAQLLSIAPTGTLSTMLGISGGIEPIFQTSYTRKIESLGDGDEYFKVITPIVEEAMKHGMKEEDVKTAMNLDYVNRIDMQSIWQSCVDNAISSTVNLPKEASIETVEHLFFYAWQKSLKGITIYRDGCKKSGILSNHAGSSVKEEYEHCPECDGKMNKTNGCSICQDCGYSPCSI